MRLFEGTGSDWNKIISKLPNPHLLQTWEWSQVKAAYGWKPYPLVWEATAGNEETIVAAAMVLKRTVLSRGFAARLCVLYCSKGPILDWSNELLRDQVLDDLQIFAKRQGAIHLKLDPDVILGTGVPGEVDAQEDRVGQDVVGDLKRRGWRDSTEQIQFRNTVWLDVSLPEDEMLAWMKQKTRYNVRLAQKKGVTIRIGTLGDLTLLYKMYAETSLRNGFVIREEAYYRKVWETFLHSSESKYKESMEGNRPAAESLIAEVDGEAVAAVFNFWFANRAYYLYGMSREKEREKMPNYLLQWESMKQAKRRGCQIYDLWGAPDEFKESDPLWDVFRFKEGLGGKVVRTLGAWDYPAKPIWYLVYTRVIPRILDLMRRRGNRRTQQALE